MTIKKESYQNVNFCLKCGNKMELQADKEGKMRPECTDCNWIYYKNPIPASACVIMNDKNEVVIINPAEFFTLCTGKISFCSGSS